MTRSIQQLPNTVSSTQIAEVSTQSGFSSGDLVYYANGDYATNANFTAPSSVNFPITQSLPAANSTGTTGIIKPVFGVTPLTTKGGSIKKSAAVLTNGNIVQVWINGPTASTNQYCPYFQIVNSSGSVVVAPTLISSTYTNSGYSVIAVVALTGGGFSVVWNNYSGGTLYCMNYAIYTNTGSVTTAVTQDTTQTFAGGASLEVVSLANGGFAVAACSASGTLYLRAYGATGTGAYAWFNTSINGSNLSGVAYSQSFAIASRSDNSVFIANIANTLNITYGLFNSSGGTIVAATTFAMGTAFTNSTYTCGPDASVLSDGTTIVIGYYSYNGTNTFPCFRLLPTGNTLGSQITAIPVINQYYNSSYAGRTMNVLGLSAGGFVMVFSDPWATLQYAFFNSSGTVVSPSNFNGAIPQNLFGGFTEKYTRVTLVETSGILNLYWGNCGYQLNTNIMSAQINETTYQPVSVNGSSSVVTTLTGAPGALISANTKPTSLTYYSGTTSSSNTINPISPVISPTTLFFGTCAGISSCTLTNNYYVIGFYTLTGLITFNVYNTLNALVNTFNITNAIAPTTSYGDAFKISALSNGGFVVAYLTTATTINMSVYTSSYALVSTVTQTAANYSAVATFDIAGLSNGNYVLTYFVSASLFYIVYSNTNLVVQTQALINSSCQAVAISPNSFGGFGVTTFDSGATALQTIYTYYQTGASAYSVLGSANYSGSSAYYAHNAITTIPSGGYMFVGWAPSTYGISTCYDNGGNTTTYYSASQTGAPFATSPATTSGVSLGTTGNGNIIVFSPNASTTAYLTVVPSGLVQLNNGPLAVNGNYPGTLSVTINSSFNTANTGSTNGPLPKVSPLLGNNVLLTWLGSDQYPRYAIYSAAPSVSTYSITSGVSVSSPVQINPNPNAGAPSITGILTGVAATTASAGSTGQVVINGLAQLNSNYSASGTGAFDYTGQAVDGVKGTYNGRTVNLQGNS